MEAGDSELNLDNYTEFELRGRSHTWPERQLIHLELDASTTESPDSGLPPSGCKSPDLLPSESSTSTSATSSTSLTEALKSNLSLIPEPDCGQESERDSMDVSTKSNFVFYSKKVPLRKQSDMQLSVTDMDKMKSDVAVSFPSVSRFSGQSMSERGTDVLPSLSLSHSTLNTRQNIVPSTGSAQVSDLKLISIGNKSGMLTLSGSGGNLPGSSISSSTHRIQNLAMSSASPHSLSSGDDSTSLINSLQSSGTLSATGCSKSNIPRSTTSSQTLAVLYFAAHPGSAEGSSVEKGSDGRGGRKPVKRKRIRKRLNGLVSTKKPNPWGAESYSDLIARALKSAFDGRMRLNEIYNWFASNVPYFGSRTSQEQSAGWKVEFSSV